MLLIAGLATLLSAVQVGHAVFAAPRDQLVRSPYATLVADFNGDTRQDIAFVNAYHQSVTIVINGGGTQPVPVGLRPADLATADFNGDLRPDLVVSNSGSATVSVLLGTAAGTFAPAGSFATGLRPGPLAIADFNGDGKPDVAVGNNQSANLSLLLGHGDGTFAPHVQTPLAFAPTAVVAADFNHDAIADVAVGGQGNISILRGTGAGTFLPPLTTPTNMHLVGDFAVSDFNQDGELDLAATDPMAARLHVFSGSGTGVFPASQVINSNYRLFSLALADVNEDGRFDLIGGGWWPCGCDLTGAIVFIRRPDGAFAAPFEVLASGDTYSVAVGDLNGDAHMDLVAAGLRTLDEGGSPPDAAFPVGTLSIRFGRGDGTFSEAPKAGGRMSSPQTADFNGDGRADLAVVVRSLSSCAISVALGTADGTLQALPLVPHPGGACGSIEVGDLNGDSRPDLLAPGWDGVAALLGNGDGTFASSPTSPISMELPTLGIGDFTGDAVADLAYIGIDESFNRLLYVQDGNGDGTFDPPVQVPFDPPGNLFGVVAADLNGDSHDDIALITGGPKHLTVLHGNGNGTFQLPVEVFTGLSDRDFPRLIAKGDVNGDGRTDLVVGNYSGSVSVVLQGNGALLPAVTYFTPYQPRTISVADVNGDTTPDLVVLNSNTLSILLGQGDGTLALQPAGFFPLQGGGSTVVATVVADFTSDGRPDIVVTNNHQQDSLALLVNVTPSPVTSPR